MRPLLLVTGGTGTLGRAVVGQARDAGHAVRVLSRRPRPDDARTDWATGDLQTGEGLAAAAGEVTAVIHCATGTRRQEDAADTARLVAALREGGARPHLVYVSIVGVDAVPLGYYRGKLETEDVVSASGLPWSIQRATQFHDLLLGFCRVLARVPVMPVPAGTSFQPVDVRDVAERLVELAEGTARGRVADMGGPEVLTTSEIARTYADRAGLRRVVLPVRVPGRTFRAYRAGGHLAPAHRDGRRTFASYLEEHVGGRR